MVTSSYSLFTVIGSIILDSHSKKMFFEEKIKNITYVASTQTTILLGEKHCSEPLGKIMVQKNAVQFKAC